MAAEYYVSGVAPGVTPQWTRCTFASAKVVTEIKIYMVNGSLASRDFKAQYWDGGAWQDISGASVTGNNTGTVTFSGLTVPSTTQIRIYYTLGCTADQLVYATEIEMTGT